MNVLITLPPHLIEAIILGRKTIELRKSRPTLMKIKEDGFFCVEKGTKEVRCWCRCDDMEIRCARDINPFSLVDSVCVDEGYIRKYLNKANLAYLWHIGKVIEFERGSLSIHSLLVDKNPQQFAYCPLSYGESY